MSVVRSGVVAVAAALALSVSGCSGDAGGSTATAAAAPQLAAALARVDSAIAAHEFTQARTRLERLITATEAAAQAGTMGEAEAQRIIDAANRLLALLPEPTPSAEPTPDTAAPQPTRSTKHGHTKKPKKGGHKGKHGKKGH